MISCFQPIISENSEILILGTIPSVISIEKDEYYGNPRNHFWKIMYSILEVEEETEYSKKVEILLENKIALWDVLSQADRIGSLDSAIKNERPNDLVSLIEIYPNIKKIIFNGTKSEQLFKRYFKELYSINRCIRVSSSSPTPGKNVKSLDEKKIQWKEVIRKGEIK